MFEQLIWVVPLAVAGAGVWRPRAGLLVLAATLPLFGSPPGGPYLAALDLAAIAAIATAWRAGRAGPSPLTWPAAAFVAVSLASLFPSPYQPPSWHPSTLLGLLSALPGAASWSALYTWRAAADLILGWGLFMAVRRAFDGRSARPLCLALAAGLSATLLVGLASLNGFVDLGGFRPYHDFYAVRRLYSFFFLSAWLAEYVVVAAPAALAALLAAGPWARRLALPFGALAVSCLGLTHQRGAWIAALTQVVFWGAFVAPRWRRRRPGIRRALLATGVAVAISGAVFVATGSSVQPLLERARSIDSGLSPRVPLWATAAEMTRERPLMGWGLGAFAPAYDLVHPPGSEDASLYRNTAHSLYFDIAAERGLFGILALGLLGWSVAACLRRPRDGQEVLALGLAVGLVGLLAYGMVQYVFHLRNLAWLCWILLGCVALTTRHAEPARAGRVARVLVAVALLVAPIRSIVGEPPGYAGSREFGLHEPESDPADRYRWTTGFAGQRVPWAGETLVLTLANGHPRAAERPVEVVVGIDGETVARLTIPGGWEEHRIELGPPTREWISLTLRARPAFRPFSDYRRYEDLPPSLDIRALGVAMREPRWERAGPG